MTSFVNELPPIAINAQAWTLDNGTYFNRRLELNFLNCNNNEIISLYDKDQQLILKLNSSEHPDEFYVTDIGIDHFIHTTNSQRV